MFGCVSGVESPGSPDLDWDDFPGSPGGRRKPAVRGRITGRITAWQNKFGWIEADSPIDHPEAQRRGGKIYLSQDDVAEVISGVGAHVSFYAYADGTGIGAMNCVPSDSAAAKAPLLKKAKSGMPKPKPKSKATPGRKRVSESLMHGKVKSWRGGFGFVTPNQAVEHPLFTGSLFLHKADISQADQLDVGQTVSFYLYADPQGLGAEECTPVDAASVPAADPGSASGQADSSTVELHETSTLLRAKPKATAGSPPPSPSDGAISTFAPPRAKATGKAMMKASAKATAKASGPARGDANLANKMTENPEMAKRLSAWMFDPGG